MIRLLSCLIFSLTRGSSRDDLGFRLTYFAVLKFNMLERSYSLEEIICVLFDMGWIRPCANLIFFHSGSGSYSRKIS